MANVKISNLPAVTVPLAGTEEIPVVQSGVTKRTAINNILNANTIPYIANGLGSVSAPSYTFTGDFNTGMWSPGADTLAFSEGGAEAMRIDSSGNVGIGTTTPGAKLDVNGPIVIGNITARGDGSEGGQITFNNAANSAGPLTLDVDASGNGRLITTVNSANLSLGQLSGTGGVVLFYTANNERMRIDASGNVGIGTSAPTSLLDVNGNAEIAGTLFLGASNHGNLGSDATQLFVRGNNVVFQNAAGSSTYVYVNSTGSVGIGTSSPDASALLDVSSTTKGFLPPRMSTAQRDAIGGATQEGLIIYNVTTDKLQVFAAGAWVNLH
jgi:hypothetical protein